MEHIFIYTFVILYILNFFLDLFLSRLNIKHLLKYPDPPKPFQEFIEAEKYQKSIRYSMSYYRFHLFSGTVSAVLFLLFVYAGWMNAIDLKLYEIVPDETWRGICFFFILSFLSYLVGIPFGLYSTFVIEEKFGFNRETLSLWFKDQVKGILVSSLFMLPLSYAILYFMSSTGAYWWVYVWCLFFLYNLILLQIYPIFIAPLFNKFSPLEQGELRTKLEELAQRMKFSIANIYVIDATKRSTHSNAYFTGFGKTKRLVLYDSLIKEFSTDEIACVVAHEIGHYQKKHILKHIILSQSTALLFFYLLSIALNHPYLYKTFLVANQSTYMGLILLSFIVSLVLSFFSPAFNFFSWKHETEADQCSLDAIEKKDAFRTMLIKLHVQNLSNLVPHPLYARFNYSHPPIKERLERVGLL
ncbi:MAG: M48 family metallopeptidase [Candidatus Brocadiae bacterium]|nr:M48 family metallopeptidase [Candidatus Brocadiia bacterium]